jgi:hypothetical protein
MGLDHPLDGVTNPKYKLLHILLTKFFCKEKKALAFNRDRCYHLVLCLQLILFHCKMIFKKIVSVGFGRFCVYFGRKPFGRMTFGRQTFGRITSNTRCSIDCSRITTIHRKFRRKNRPEVMATSMRTTTSPSTIHRSQQMDIFDQGILAEGEGSVLLTSLH